jgi:NAD dependent epimerase/dehydratase family enzyme
MSASKPNKRKNQVLNGVAPQMATQRSIPDIMKEQWQQPLSIMPLPTILANWKFGDRAPFMLRSQKVSGDAALRAGFEFQYPTLQEAIKALEMDLRGVKYVQPPLEEWEK